LLVVFPDWGYFLPPKSLFERDRGGSKGGRPPLLGRGGKRRKEKFMGDGYACYFFLKMKALKGEAKCEGGIFLFLHAAAGRSGWDGMGWDGVG
jgi:hypothetical protein